MKNDEVSKKAYYSGDENNLEEYTTIGNHLSLLGNFHLHFFLLG